MTVIIRHKERKEKGSESQTKDYITEWYGTLR